MFRKIVCIFAAVIVAVSLGGDQRADSVRTSGAAALQAGITLDCARRYYSPEQLRRYIDLLSGRGGSFLQLHLTDNENVGVECIMLGQTAEKAVRTEEGAYKNTCTGGLFLSRKQIRALISYAGKKGVDIIPEIDAPAHMGGFFTLAEAVPGKYGDDLQADEGELDISDPVALDFVRKIYTEYAELFRGCRYFHIGCDELFSADGEDSDVTDYISLISGYLVSKGYTVRMWNDMLTKKNIGKVPDTVQVTYWSYDGDTDDPDERAERRASRISVPELQARGFKVLVYNSYYLYYIPSDGDNEDDCQYMVKDLQDNWNPGVWDGQNGERLKSMSGIEGMSVSVWGEDSEGCSADDIYRQTCRMFDAMVSKMPQQ